MRKLLNFWRKKNQKNKKWELIFLIYGIEAVIIFYSAYVLILTIEGNGDGFIRKSEKIDIKSGFWVDVSYFDSSIFERTEFKVQVFDI